MTLAQSSPLTREWINRIRIGVVNLIPTIQFEEVKYYAKFISAERNRVIAYLNPIKRNIRLFLRIDMDQEIDIDQTPSSSDWAETFPSIYNIDSIEKIERAIELIVFSYQNNLLE